MQCNGFLDVNSLLAGKPVTITLPTLFALPRASSTHWIMGLPATSTMAFDSPCVYAYKGSSGLGIPPAVRITSINAPLHLIEFLQLRLELELHQHLFVF